MKTFLFALSAMTLVSLSSCSIIKGVLGIPFEILDVVADGVGFMSDEEGVPLRPETSPVFSERDISPTE